jgi:hypothetical protein
LSCFGFVTADGKKDEKRKRMKAVDESCYQSAAHSSVLLSFKFEDGLEELNPGTYTSPHLNVDSIGLIEKQCKLSRRESRSSSAVGVEVEDI